MLPLRRNHDGPLFATLVMLAAGLAYLCATLGTASFVLIFLGALLLLLLAHSVMEHPVVRSYASDRPRLIDLDGIDVGVFISYVKGRYQFHITAHEPVIAHMIVMADGSCIRLPRVVKPKRGELITVSLGEQIGA